MTAQKEFSRLSLFPASRASLGQIYDTNQLRMFVCVLYIFILLKTTEYYFWKAVVQLENKREWSL